MTSPLSPPRGTVENGKGLYHWVIRCPAGTVPGGSVGEDLSCVLISRTRARRRAPAYRVRTRCLVTALCREGGLMMLARSGLVDISGYGLCVRVRPQFFLACRRTRPPTPAAAARMNSVEFHDLTGRLDSGSGAEQREGQCAGEQCGGLFRWDIRAWAAPHCVLPSAVGGSVVRVPGVPPAVSGSR